MINRVLVVEDDELLGSSLCRALAASGYDTDRATTLAAARESFAAQRPDLILLDISLPDGDGLGWCSEVHHIEPTLPIIMLTARVEEIDIVVGLTAGAVDYVTKPFRLAELLARVDRHLRVAELHSAETTDHTIYVVEDVRVDLDSRRAWLADAEIELRPREFDLLARLMRDAGKVVKREDLISDLWDEHWFGSTKTLDVHITHLRRRFGEEAGDVSRISAVRGIGYRFELAE